LRPFEVIVYQKRGVTEEFPFDADTLVFKVMGKMFALTDLDNFESVNLKCDPEKAVQLREEFSFGSARLSYE
jgi:predicted DNA-binding protein (MmcQ/YjbR family)